MNAIGRVGFPTDLSPLPIPSHRSVMMRDNPTNSGEEILMERWLGYALLSAVFAGMTSVIAKIGLTGISGDLGLALRTCFVFVLVLLFAVAVVPRTELQSLTSHNVLWLALSAATTAASWICYYRAVKLGEVSTVALIDKGSVLVAIALAVIVLKETLTAQKAVGGALIIVGMLVIARR